MRNSLLTILLVLMGIGGASVMAQPVCIPDQGALLLGIPGIYPIPVQSSLTPGTQGVAYAQTITFIVPIDTTLDLSVLNPLLPNAVNVGVNYQKVTAVNGLPTGLNFACDPTNCQWASNSNGCLKISGTPTQGGSFTVGLSTSYNIAIPAQIPILGGTNVDFPLPGISWPLEITSTTNVADENANELRIAQNAPNPFHGTTTINYNAPKPSAIEFVVTDLTGKVMHMEQVRANAGDNAITFDASDLAPGIYLYRISNGVKSVTSKMVVQ